jgi:hypothetical protein
VGKAPKTMAQRSGKIICGGTSKKSRKEHSTSFGHVHPIVDNVIAITLVIRVDALCNGDTHVLISLFLSQFVRQPFDPTVENSFAVEI